MTHIYLDHILQIYYLIQHHLAMPYTDLLFVHNVYEIIESFSLTHYMNITNKKNDINKKHQDSIMIWLEK